MEKKKSPVEPEDYQEPACLLCAEPMGKQPVLHPIPIHRVTEKLDACMDCKNYDGAVQLLQYWLQEAEQAQDLRGQFSLYNEKMGLCRKLGKQEEAFHAAQKAQALLQAVGEDSLSAGTCLVNCATVYEAFGQLERAIPLFQRAKVIYEQSLSADDGRLGGLYNNMALALTACGQYEQAEQMNRMALQVMQKVENGELEMAMTYLNMADTATCKLGSEAAEETVNGYLEQAAALLDCQTLPRNGYYAFVCEKCQSVFAYYGWFAYAEALKERYETIDAGNGAL